MDKKEIAEKILGYVDQAKDFLLEEAPQVYQEIIKYHQVLGLITFLLASCLCVAFGKAFIFFWKKDREEAREDFTGEILFSLCISMGCFVWAILGFNVFLKAWLGPRMFLLEFLIE